MLMEVLFLITYTIIGVVLLPISIQFLSHHEVTADNYHLHRIPIGLGLYLWAMLIVYLLLLKITNLFEFTGFHAEDRELFYTYVITLTVIVFVGWMDDTIGDKRVKGFSGHFAKWKDEKVITTGLLKAGTTCVMALWMVLEINESLLMGVIQFLMIILMTNTVNLLDLRPGRSLKAFFAFSGVVIIFGSWQLNGLYLLPILIAALLVFPKDLQAKIMLGDTGANYLGFAIGFCMAIASPYWLQIAVLFILIGTHWVAERSSITKIVENNPLLNWIDRWGRV